MAHADFAVFGGSPLFDRPIPVGQLYFPDWDRYEQAMRGIFERQYYTNQGPLVDALEERLQKFLGVKHAICVTNATIGLMMGAQALGLNGKVVVPAFTFIASAQSLSWSGVQPVFCDVDRVTQQITPACVEPLLTKDVSGILAVNLWGASCAPAVLCDLAKRQGVPIYFDSAQAFGCRVDGVPIGNFGELEVFSFHATKILSATEGGCVCTNDDQLAARLRNIRSSYGARFPVEVVKTANGRMSEAQAAIALLSLDDFDANRANNEKLFQNYAAGLSGIPGVKLFHPCSVSESNYQYLVCHLDEAEFGVGRDVLLKILRAENILARRYFHPGVHRCIPYSQAEQITLPNTEWLCETGFQLPIGALVNGEIVKQICDLIRRIHQSSQEIKGYV